jgi:2-dehydro-3-deoxy-D-arabinonate dehydratase
MNVYNLKNGILIKDDKSAYLVKDRDWDSFINDDNLYDKLSEIIQTTEPVSGSTDELLKELLPPIGSQEIWASGVTYSNSKLARQAESAETGGGEFYARVYAAERPEIFFKATSARAVGSEGKVRIRKDSNWDVPEPELTLVLTSTGKIVGYTIGNDMSSRSIEGENPLYLPQAKTYDGCVSVGPGIFVTKQPLSKKTEIEMEILRSGKQEFHGTVEIGQMKRELVELADWLFRELTFPSGCLLMTGTGIVPGDGFTLQSGDEIRIAIGPIGILVNVVA